MLDFHLVIENKNQLITILDITPTVTSVLVFILLVLFVLSFLFSGSEMAFFSLTVKDMNMLKARQQPSYRRIVTLLENPKTLMASLLISNAFVNIGIILISNSLLNEWIQNLGLPPALNFIIKVIVITALVVLFCEGLPRGWGSGDRIWWHHKKTRCNRIHLFGEF